MVRIPRAEPSLQPSIAMQPQAAGSGWGAPGRAIQQLGSAISSLSGAFEGLGQEQIAEQDFQDKMLMLKTDNELGLNQVEAQATYSGTGDDYLPSRSEYYDTTTGSAIKQMQPRNQQKAALFFEQRRGPYLERDAKFGGQRRQETLVNTIDDAVSTEYGKLAGSDPEEFETRFRQTVTATDAIISSAPLPDKIKDQIASQAAERGYQILNGLAEDPETAPEIVPQILRMLEETPGEINGGALTEQPEAQPAPRQGPEGVQGLPGSPSGPALPQPQKLGAADVAPPQGAVTQPQAAPAQFRILDQHAPSVAERNKIFRSGGVVINLDTNWAPKGKATSPMVVIPDNATKVQRQAAEAYARGIADTYREKFGVDLKPKVVTRSQNGRGRPSTIHTEPFSVNDEKAAAYFTSPEGAQRHAQILRETFGKVPGAVFSIPHDPTGSRKDHGAVGPLGNEVELARVVLAQLGSSEAPAQQPTQFAEASKLGAGDIAEGSNRAPNTIPGEPTLVAGPDRAVRVADASGRFVPQLKPQTWRSVDSQLRDLLIKNMGRFKKMEAEAARKAERIADEKTREARQGTEREGLELMFSRKLTREWVEQNGPLLSNEAYGRFMRHVTPKAYSTDPTIYTDLLERADEKPEDVINEASDAYASGQLDQDAFERVYSKASRAMRPDTRRPPWVNEYRSMVKRNLRPDPGDKTVDTMKAYGDALEKFDDYVEEQKASGKELDRKGLAAFSEQMVKDYKFSQVADKRKALSMPRFSQVSRDAMTLEEVDAAVQRTIEAAKSGKLRPEELKIEASNLRKWKEALEAEAVAKGEKPPVAKPPVKKDAGPSKPRTDQSPAQPEDLGGSDFGPPMRLGGPKDGETGKPKPNQESRPLGGALGVVPLAENPDGSVTLSVPGMLLEPFRAFVRGLNREALRGQYDESGKPLYDPKAQSEDALLAAGTPLAATSFGSAVGAVPKGALGSGMARAGEQAAAKEIDPQGFYSGLDEALKGFKPTDSVTADTLSKRGVKRAEIEARGMTDLLADGKAAKVSDLQDVAGKNRVEVREKNYGANNPEFDALQMKGAELRERIDALRASGRDRERSLLGNGKTVDELEAEWSAMNARWREMDAASPKAKWSRYSLDPSNPTYRETVLHLPSRDKVGGREGREVLTDDILDDIDPKWRTNEDFQSGHWSEPNVIAHARTSIQKDAQGKDVFVVNELQSDWGQKLRDGGVRDEAKIAELQKTRDEAVRRANDLRLERRKVADFHGNLSPEKQGIDDAIKAAEEAERLAIAELKTAQAATPGHPLVNTTDQWVNTGLRRMITQAVESGADQIAIPSGDTVKAFGMGGKEEGLKYAYDQMYPKNLRNILKKLDPSIEPVKVDHLFGQKGQALERSKGFITFKITPKLREAVKKEGMPLFTGGVPVDGSERGEAE
jgi:hypothetical protein